MKKNNIESGEIYLGIEFGSTRIKAVLIDNTFVPLACGEYSWQNRFVDGYWTYSEEEFIKGLKGCFSDLVKNVYSKYGCMIKRIKSIGISGMMHGYLAFDKDFNLLVPFRTWRNTTTAKAAKILSEKFKFNVPQRWSIAHLYQAILDNEPHIGRIAHITTLAGYIHYLLTGDFSVGIGEASGIFPVGSNDYDADMLDKFDCLLKEKNIDLCIRDILPKVKMAGDEGAYLTVDGASLLDDSGNLTPGIPFCPPEGDAGTGMVATNSIKPSTGSISAGTSVFSMFVLEKPMKNYYEEIDIAATPDGSTVAMIHCNNGCFELDEWVNMFYEFSALSGSSLSKSEIYQKLYENTLNGNSDCSNITAYNFLASEPIVGVSNGKIMYFKENDSKFNLANFLRAQLYSTIAALRVGADILFNNEGVVPTEILAHGGLFKVKGVAQQYVADAFGTKTSVMSTAGEGGPWGMAILAAYMDLKQNYSLVDFLDEFVFASFEKAVVEPSSDGKFGFDIFLERYLKGLQIQKSF